MNTDDYEYATITVLNHPVALTLSGYSITARIERESPIIINGVPYDMRADFKRDESGAWRITENRIYMQRLDGPFGIGREPTMNAYRKLRDAIVAAVSEWQRDSSVARLKLHHADVKCRLRFEHGIRDRQDKLRAEIKRLDTMLEDSSEVPVHLLHSLDVRRELY